MTKPFFGLLLLAYGLTGCLKRDASNCDQANPCPNAGTHCNLTTFKCDPDDQDMSMCEGTSCTDAGPDLAKDLAQADLVELPDLMPLCTVSTVATSCSDPAAPICDTSTAEGMCIACRNSSDDAQCTSRANGKNHCKTGGGPCVQCNGNSDCSGTNPICDANSCRGCRKHAECPSGICAFDGTCVAAANILAVDKNSTAPACVDAPASGTGGNPPFCEINYAINNTTNTYYLVKGGATAYSKVAFANNTADRTIVVVGPGPTPSPTPGPATISPGGNRGIQLNVDGSHTIDITFDGLVLSGATGGNGFGVDCVGGDRTKTTFRLLRSTVTTNAQIGVQGSQCYIILDQDTIGSGNTAGGVFLTNCDFSVTNSLVFSNGGAGTSFGGLSIGGIFTTKVLSNLTIVKNSSMSPAPSGVVCGSALTVTNTILFGNAGGPQATAGLCLIDHSAFASATATYDLTSCSADGSDTFQNYAMDDYQLKTAGPAGCILVDKGATPATSPMVPAIALAGTARPQGAAWDVGCFEQ